MDIHVVQFGETIDTIAERYGVSVEKLVRDNELLEPYQLIPGETIVIAYPSQAYIVQEGDSLASIATNYNITVSELLRNNPFLVDREFIYPGEELVISYNRTENVITHGYANSFVNTLTLRKTLPFLTYLTVFNYRTSKNGEVIATADDTEILQLSRDYGVIPLLLMTTISVIGEVDLDLTYQILVDQEIQNRLFDNIINIVRDRGYYGVNISAQYITSENQELFYNYTKNLSDRLHQEGFLSVITINPKVESIDNEVLFENIDYTKIGNVVDLALFLQYKWGFNFGPPSPVISSNDMNIFLDYALTQIPKEKIFVGVPTLGYDWELPFLPGFSRASALTIYSVMRLARDVNAIIEFDTISQTPYFRYMNPTTENLHELWFVNSLTINSIIDLLLEKDITGTGVWNVMLYFAQLWLVINSQYEIIKHLPEF